MPPPCLVRDSALFPFGGYWPGTKQDRPSEELGPQSSNNTGASGAVAALRAGSCLLAAVAQPQLPLLHQTGLLPAVHKPWMSQRQQVRHASSAAHRWLQPQPAEGRSVQRPTAPPDYPSQYPSQGVETRSSTAPANGDPRAHRWIPQRGSGQQQQQKAPWPPSVPPVNRAPPGRASPTGFANGEQRAQRWPPRPVPPFPPDGPRRRPPPGSSMNAFRPRPQQQRPPTNAGGRPRPEGPRKAPPPKPRPPEKDVVLGLVITVAGLARQLGELSYCAVANEH